MPEQTKIVDQWGQPFSPATAQVEPPLRRTKKAPPVFNPEPEKLKAVFKKADDGDPRELQQLTADLEGRDGHFGGVLETRRRAVTRLPWRAVATTDDKLAVDIVDAVQRDILDARWFRPMVRSLLDAVVKGWSVCSIQWSYGDVWRPATVRWVDQQVTGVMPDDDQRVAWRDPKDENKLVPIAAYTAVVHAASDPSGPLYRRGIGRSLAMLYSLKRLGLSAWAGFIELFGIARPVVSYPPGSRRQDIDDFEARIQQWMHGGYMVKPDNLNVAFPEPSNTRMGAGEPVQAALARWCDDQASKRIVGVTMTSDQGSSRSQAEVHERVAGWITEGDATDLAETIMRDLVVPYVWLNYGMDAPLPIIGAVIESSERRWKQVEAIEHLAPLGLKVEMSFVRDLIGIPEPAEDAELLEPRRAPPAAGASRRRGERVESASMAFARQLRAAQAARGAGAAAGPLHSAQLAADEARRRRGAQARRTVAHLADDGGDGGDLVDRDAGEAAEKRWNRDLAPFVRAAEEEAEAADSYSDFLRRLKQRGVDGDDFVRSLATTDMQMRGVGDGTDDL